MFVIQKSSTKNITIIYKHYSIKIMCDLTKKNYVIDTRIKLKSYNKTTKKIQQITSQNSGNSAKLS